MKHEINSFRYQDKGKSDLWQLWVDLILPSLIFYYF